MPESLVQRMRVFVFMAFPWKSTFMCAINLSIFTDLEHHIHLHSHDQSFCLSINCKKDDYDNNYLVILTHGEFLIRFRR